MPYKIIRAEQPPKIEESLPATALRTGLRTAARIGEAAVGLPGDIAQAALGAANYISGGAVPTYGQVQEKLPISLPTSENVKQFQEKATGEYLKPQGENEQTWDDFIGLVTQLAIPISGPAGLAKAGALTKAAKAVPQAAKIAGVGTLGARAVKELGGGELAQEGTKLGLMLATGLQGSRKVLENRLDTNYQTLEKLATGATQDASKLRNVVRTVRSDVEKGIQTTEKKTVSNLLNEVNDSIYKGRQGISVAEAVELDKDINEILRDRSTSPKIKKQLSKVQDGLSGVLEDYGERNKPWLNVYRETKDLDNGFNNRSVINDFLQNEVSLEGRLKSSIGKNLVFGGVFGSGLYNLGAKSLASVPVAIGLRESVKMAEFLRNSKVARKYYVDTMNAALSNNKNAFAQAASKLDKVAEKYEEKHPSEKRYRIIRAT